MSFMMPEGTHPIAAVLARGVRRLRALRAADRAAALAIPGALLCAGVFVLDRFRPVGPEGLRTALATAAGLPLAGLFVGLLLPVDRRRVATAIDAASGLHDRLGTAWGLTRGLTAPAPAGLPAAAVRDATRHAGAARPDAAYPIRPPRGARALLLAGVAAALAVLLRVPEPPAHPSVPPRAPAALADPEALRSAQAQAQALEAQARELEDVRLGEIGAEIGRLVDSLQGGRTDLKRAFERIQALEARLEDGRGLQAREAKAARQAMKEAAKELRASKRDEAAALADALDKGDLEAVRDRLEDLARLLDSPLVPDALVKQLAKMLEKSAEQLAKRFDAAMRKELGAELDRLRELLRKQGLSERERQRMSELQEQMRQKPGAGEQGGQAARSVNRLSQRLKDAGDKADQGGQQGRQDASEELMKGAQDVRDLHRAMRNQQARQDAERRLSELKEALRQGQQGGQARRQARREGSFRARAGGARADGGRRGEDAAGKPRAGRQAGKLERRQELEGGGHGDAEGDKRGGRAGKLNTRRTDEFVAGKEQGGPIDEEVILDAAREGFARTRYRDVFARYRDAAEEELVRDEVPPGYRRYVYRYFELIRPAEGARGDGGRTEQEPR